MDAVPSLDLDIQSNGGGPKVKYSGTRQAKKFPVIKKNTVCTKIINIINPKSFKNSQTQNHYEGISYI